MLVAVMVTVVAVVFLPVVLKTVAPVISAEDNCADEIRTRGLTVHCSWLLQTGECEGEVCERKDTRGQQVSASAGCAASSSSCQQVLSSYQHPRPLHPEEAPPSLPVTEVSPAGRGLGGAYGFASATTSLPLPGPNLAETLHLTYFPCALSCERPCYPGKLHPSVPTHPLLSSPGWPQVGTNV